MKQLFAGVADATKFEKAINETKNIFSNQENINSNTKAFMSLLIYHTSWFSTKKIQNIREENPREIPMFFRTSPEDAIFSILSKQDARILLKLSTELAFQNKIKSAVTNVSQGTGDITGLDENLMYFFKQDGLLRQRSLLGNDGELFKLAKTNEIYTTKQGVKKAYYTVINQLGENVINTPFVLTMPRPDARRDLLKLDNSDTFVVTELRNTSLVLNQNILVNDNWNNLYDTNKNNPGLMIKFFKEL